MSKSFIAGALALLLATPVSAQDATEDWDFGQNPDRDLTIASVSFENFGVAVRCIDETLSVLVTGVQSGEGEQRIRYAMADTAEADTAWIGAPGGRTLFSVWPAATATDLQKGGRLSLGIPDGERIRRVAVDLPASPTAIGRVFAACGREVPREDSEQPDGENLSGLRWRSVPQPTFPSGINAEAGIAALMCKTDDNGAPRDCRIESEFPEGGGFGRAAVLGAHRNGRVALVEGGDGQLGGRTIAFLVRYNMAPIDAAPVSRIAPPRATVQPASQDD